MRSNGKPVMQAQTPVYDGEIEETGARALATVRGGGTLQRTQTQYMTAVAVQKERDLDKIIARVEREAAIIGQDFIYSMKFKNKDGTESRVEGTSIDGAMILQRNWGNCVTEVDIAEEAPSHWVFRATFVDLELGSTVTRLYRQRKSESHMRGDAERKIDIAFQIGQSKAIRNVVVKAIPAWLEKAAVTKAMDAAAAGIKDLEKAITGVVVAFSKIGVTESMIERLLSIPRAQWTALDVVRLRAIGRAIKDGQTSVADEFVTDADFAAAETKKKAESEAAQKAAEVPAAATTTPTDVSGTDEDDFGAAEEPKRPSQPGNPAPSSPTATASTTPTEGEPAKKEKVYGGASS